MKKHLLAKILLAFSALLPLFGCTELSYVADDVEVVKSSRIQTNENFSLQAVEKSLGDVIIKAGISETVLDSALVLYIQIQNNSPENFKFDINEINISSPIGEVSKIPPNLYIDGFYNFEVSNYVAMSNAGSTLGGFAAIQNQYLKTNQNQSSNLENITNTNPEFASIEKTVKGIQKHTLYSYKYVGANRQEYYYIFIRKPDEYPIVVNYKNLTYKFGGKKNEE